MQACACYEALGRYRRDRQRCKRFHFGDQWSDTVTANGATISEYEFLSSQGSTPLKNNLIRRLVRNVVGVFISQVSQPRCVVRDARHKRYGEAMTDLLRYNADINRLPAIYARSLEEFLISGMVVHRKGYAMRNGRMDCWTDYVHPNNFFIDTNMSDFRGWDCTCIGEVHDISFDKLCAQFARSPQQAAELEAVYALSADRGELSNQWREWGYASGISHSFMFPSAPGLCRVIEVWRREMHRLYRCRDPKTGREFKIAEADYAALVEKPNRRRPQAEKIAAEWAMEERWHYYYLSPAGDVLASGASPYMHGQHPYVVKAYPLIDGEIHSFVSDVIDQQKYTNRLITLYDWILRASAKGVLLIPQDSLPEGCHPRQFAEAWGRCNGVIMYKHTPHGEVPKQVVANANVDGVTDLLNIQLKLFEDISGVHGALEGRLTNANVSAALYGQQTEYATLSLLDLLNTFQEFMRDAASKDMSIIRQYYTPQQVNAILGDAAVDLTSEDARNLEYDLTIASALTSSRSKENNNALLKDLLDKGHISFETFLAGTDLPFADAIKPETKQ